MTHGRTGLMLFAWAVFAGCGGGEPSPDAVPAAESVAAQPESARPPALADTSWHLVEFRSMDDATGVRTPEKPDRYTMKLQADGTVTFRLNCNQATGTWKAEPAGGGTSGSFELGPIAATLAICPEPNMDRLVGEQMSYVRGYVLRDGNLYLSLLADGGIFAWAPYEQESTAE